MGRLVCFCLALALALCAVSTRGRAAEDKTPDKARHDARLDQRVSVATAYDSLEEFCAKLGRMTEGPAQQAADQTSVGATSSLGIPHDKPEVANQTTPAAPSLVGQPSRLSGFGGGNGRPQGVAPTGEASPSTSAPVDISCDPAIKDHKLVVRVKEQPLREVMRQIAVLFDFTWMQGPQEHPRYHLMQSTARAKLANDLRKRYITEKEARYRLIVKDTLRAAATGRDERLELAQRDPDAVAAAAMQPEGYYDIFLTLDEVALDDILAGRLVTVPLASATAGLQAKLKEDFLRRRAAFDGPGADKGWQWPTAEVVFEREADGGAIHAWLNIQGPNGLSLVRSHEVASLGGGMDWAYNVWVADSVGESDNTGLPNEPEQKLRSLQAEYGINYLSKARDQAIEAVPRWARPKDRPQIPAPSRKRVALTGREDELPLLLLDIAESLDIDLVADCYWNHDAHDRLAIYPSSDLPLYPAHAQGKQPRYVDANPEYTLEHICGQRCCGWAKDGDTFRVRNLMWFVDDPKEVPASVLNEWMRRTNDQKRITLADYLYMVESLSVDLAGEVGSTHYRGREYSLEDIGHHLKAEGYCYLKLYSLLPAGLRAAAQVTGLSVYTELPRNLQPLVARALPDPVSLEAMPASKAPERGVAAMLGDSRLWVGYRTYEYQTMNPEGPDDAERQLCRHLCIELWSGQAPDWGTGRPDYRAPGLLLGHQYPLLPGEPVKRDAPRASGAE